MNDILEKSIITLEFDKIASQLSTYARTQQGRELCLKAKIMTDYDEVQSALTCTKEAKELLDKVLDLPIDYLTVLDTISQEKLNTYLDEKELIGMAKSLRTSRLVKNFMRENTINDSHLSNISMKLIPNKDLEDKIFAKFDDADNLKKDATDVLAGLYNELKSAEKETKSKINELLSSPDFSQYLQEQIYTIRDNRIVFPVLVSAKNKVPGITHDVSATNKTAYIEPSQLVALNNKMREIKVKIHEEAIRILKELTKFVKLDFENIKINEKIISELDYHFAKARYAIKTNSVEPELTQDKVIKMYGIKHPMLLKRPTLVENDFILGDDYKAMIITGSNTGGKTVTLKTVGIFVLMTRAGMFLPCKAAKLYPFKQVLADIGDEQDISQNLSTFSSHMNNIINMLNIVNEDSLVLLDEICAGTDPQEGASLAEVILDKITEQGALSVTTTHFGELKTLEYTNSNFKNACVEFDRETLQPTYKLTIGIPGASNAIFIAGNLGLDKELVDRAGNTLHIQRDPSSVVIEKLQETQQKLTKNLQDVEAMKLASIKVKEDYENKLTELRKDKRKTIKAIENKFMDEFNDVRIEIKEMLNDLQKDKNEKNIRRTFSKLSTMENDFRNHIDMAMDKQTYDELTWDTIKVGDIVMIKDLNQPVTVVSLPDKNDNLTVQMGQIKTKINKEQVAKLDKSLTGKPKLKLRQPTDRFELKHFNLSNTIDLRGYKVDDALNDLENYLDKASLVNLTPLYVIHGNGTGALRNYIRDYISTSPYVAKFRAGEQSEGGDGVTVIDLN